MLVTGDLELNIDAVEESLAAAKTILDDQWLVREHKKEPQDFILGHRLMLKSPRQITQTIREGKSNEMHPLAEAVLIGEEVVGHYRRNGNLVGSSALYRLCALRDVVRRKDSINNIESRLPRLQGEQWKSALYELLTAAAYSEHTRVSLIEEGVSAVPDLEVQLTPVAFVECKAKLQREDVVERFTWRCRREALGAIRSYLVQVDSGFIIRIEVKENETIPKLPQIIQQMVTQGIEQKRTLGAAIFITPVESRPRVLPRPMPVHSAELWEWMVGFKEWREWHEIHTSGDFKMQNLSNFIATEVQRPVLICYRSSGLAHGVQNIRQTLKDACRNQFKKHSPGILHVLVNTDLYGIGSNVTPARIAEDLKKDALSVLREYSRLSAVLFDVVTPPPPGSLRCNHLRLRFSTENTKSKMVHLPPIASVFLL